MIATLVTPYSIHLIPEAAHFPYSNTLFKNFATMAAMDFRRPEHFVLLILFLSACLGLGLQRSRDLFKILLLTFWAVLAFRIQRESWCIVLPSVAMLADAIGSRAADSVTQRAASKEKMMRFAVIVATSIVLLVSFFRLPTNQVLQVRLRSVMPVAACDYIRDNHLPGPIFNEYRWGGYLTWNLPEYPVAIDERLNLYGDQVGNAYFDVIMGKQRLETFPSFAGAQTILLPVDLAMTRALTEIPQLQEQFREVYRDDVAVVIVRR